MDGWTILEEQNIKSQQTRMKSPPTNQNLSQVDKIFLSRNYYLLSPRAKNTIIPTSQHYPDINIKPSTASRRSKPLISQENKRLYPWGKGTSKNQLGLCDNMNPEKDGQSDKIKASRSPKGIKDILNKMQSLGEQRGREEKAKTEKEQNLCQFTFGN